MTDWNLENTAAESSFDALVSGDKLPLENVGSAAPGSGGTGSDSGGATGSGSSSGSNSGSSGSSGNSDSGSSGSGLTGSMGGNTNFNNPVGSAPSWNGNSGSSSSGSGDSGGSGSHSSSGGTSKPAGPGATFIELTDEDEQTEPARAPKSEIVQITIFDNFVDPVPTASVTAAALPKGEPAGNPGLLAVPAALLAAALAIAFLLRRRARKNSTR